MTQETGCKTDYRGKKRSIPKRVGKIARLTPDELLRVDNAHTDTLALMVNEEVREIIETGRADIAKGSKIPLDV